MPKNKMFQSGFEIHQYKKQYVARNRRGNCGKKKEIEKFSAMDYYKMETLLGRGDARAMCPYI
jgi:hypothetical protein